MPGTTTTAAGAALETTDGAPPDTAIAKQRKKLDPRILTLIQNGVLDGHRSVVVLIGDHGREQVVNLHFLLAKQKIARPSVLWCYKTELGFSSHRQKRANQIKRAVSRGIREVDEEDPFELFVASTDIRYCYYKDSERILGQTFGMLVLQVSCSVLLCLLSFFSLRGYPQTFLINSGPIAQVDHRGSVSDGQLVN